MTRGRARAVAVGAAAVITFVGAAPAFGQSPCDLANGTVTTGRLDVAHDMYSALLKSPSPPACAATGLKSVAARQASAQILVAQARTAKELGDKAGAVAKLAAALKIDPSSREAQTLVAAIAGTPTDAYLGAEALREAGYVDEARAEAQRIAKEVVPGTAIPDNLRGPHRWTAPLDAFVATVTSGSVAAGLVIIAIALLLLVRWRVRPRVTIETFADPSKDLAIGAALTDKLVDEIQSSGTGRSFEWVSDAVAEPDLKIADALGEQWKWLGAIVNRVARPRLITVNGEASVWTSTGESAMTEATLTLKIINHKHRIIDSRSFRQRRAADPAALLLSLLPVAGAWVNWTLADKTRAVRTWSMLGTKDWRSWGQFRQGFWHQEHGELEAARGCYLDSIATDVDNVAAWLNLASLDTRLPKSRDAAIERLNVVARSIPAANRRTNTLWYRAQYMRCVALLERSTQKTPTSCGEDDRTTAREQALDLVRNIGAVQAQLQRPRAALASLTSREVDDLRTLVDANEGRAVSLLASVLVASGQWPPIDPQPNQTRDESLACLARLEGDVTVENVLRLLFGLRSDATLSTSAHYNLACMYARAFCHSNKEDGPTVGDYLEPMLRHLERGVEASPANVVEARDRDPAFAAVRANTAANAKFTRLLDSLIPAKPEIVSPDEWQLVVA
jgi:tetratricopeptide (TPR) repeat protein